MQELRKLNWNFTNQLVHYNELLPCLKNIQIYQHPNRSPVQYHLTLDTI